MIPDNPVRHTSTENAMGAKKTAIYIVSYYSNHNGLSGSSGQYKTVEEAIESGEWPYDNGDDPSFYVARHGGPLTWGVCRTDLRTALRPGNVVVFFSSTSISERQSVYRLSAVATVADRVDHRAAHVRRRFMPYPYINTMIGRDNGNWRYNESDRPIRHRHLNWFWRMADTGLMTKAQFDRAFKQIYTAQEFSEKAVLSGQVKMAYNYIVFSPDPNETFISPAPPPVAVARKGSRERWSNLEMKRLTVGEAARHRARGYLRAATPTGHAHRHIRFEMDAKEAQVWRATLISGLRATSKHGAITKSNYMRKKATVCGS